MSDTHLIANNTHLGCGGSIEPYDRVAGYERCVACGIVGHPLARVGDLQALADRAAASAAAAERERIVAWLRLIHDDLDDRATNILHHAADAIERGEHGSL